MGYRNPRLTPFGRRLLDRRIETLGWPVAAVATAAEVSRQICLSSGGSVSI